MKRHALEVDPSAGERLFETAQTCLDTMERIPRRLYSADSLALPISEFFERLCVISHLAAEQSAVSCQLSIVQSANDGEAGLLDVAMAE